MGMKKNLEYTAMESADIEAFREATMELDNTYSLFYKACGLSEAEYWSLILDIRRRRDAEQDKRYALFQQTDA